MTKILFCRVSYCVFLFGEFVKVFERVVIQDPFKPCLGT